jgi:RNA-splicing ligase RtcB
MRWALLAVVVALVVGLLTRVTTPQNYGHGRNMIMMVQDTTIVHNYGSILAFDLGSVNIPMPKIKTGDVVLINQTNVDANFVFYGVPSVGQLTLYCQNVLNLLADPDEITFRVFVLRKI